VTCFAEAGEGRIYLLLDLANRGRRTSLVSLAAGPRIVPRLVKVFFKDLTQNQISDGGIFEIFNANSFCFDSRDSFHEPRVYFLQMVDRTEHGRVGARPYRLQESLPSEVGFSPVQFRLSVYACVRDLSASEIAGIDEPGSLGCLDDSVRVVNRARSEILCVGP
jgi:hypothetical protein